MGLIDWTREGIQTTMISTAFIGQSTDLDRLVGTKRALVELLDDDNAIYKCFLENEAICLAK